MNDKLTLRGDVIIERRRNDGTVIDREELKNLIVNVGRERVSKLINGVSTTPFGYIAIGEGSVAPVVGNTALGSEVDRASATKTYEADYKSVFEKTFTFASGISYAITEACVGDSASASGDTLLDRFTFSAKNVDADTSLYIKITVTVA